MKRKVLSVFLTAAMAVGMLAGCGSSASTASGSQSASTEAVTASSTETASVTSETSATAATGDTDPQMKKKIKILSIWAEDNDNGVLINQICNDYKKVNPNFDYEYEYVASDDLKQKIATLAASNDLPDVFVYESGKPIVDLINADQIVDISDVLKKYNCADYIEPSAESLLTTLSQTDDLYDLPLGLNIEGFWYNKALFQKAGVEVPSTWDEFDSALKKLKDAGIQPLACGGADKWGATRLINAYTVRTLGPDAMKKAADGDAKYTDAGYVAAAQKLQDWANAGYFGQGVTTVDMNTAGTMLMTGKAAMFYNGSWFTSNLNDTSANAAGADGIGFFNIPVQDESISGADSYSMNCGNILCLGKAKYDDATGWFVKYFVEHMGDTAMTVQGSVKGYTYTADTSKATGYTQLVLQEMAKAKSSFTWYEATMGSEVSTVAQENVQSLLNGDMSAQDYMKSIQDASDSQAE
ncbi:MAG: extracellular solute-binding protein [Butyrivibrio sp.]|jgi:raffinose/stachyose/melibiose transport system substrate-binding protein|nr:extracellular solute-binding protein [Butyrivibrio sp.]